MSSYLNSYNFIERGETVQEAIRHQRRCGHVIWSLRAASIAACGLALTVTAAHSALASIPDANGIYYGCVKIGTGQQPIYVIDTAVTTSCGKGETEITWSQTGPQGPIGPIGPT